MMSFSHILMCTLILRDKAMEIASQEHSMNILGLYTKLTMLGEELTDRMLDASNEALQRSIKAREKAILKRTEQNRFLWK